ncbi:AT-rich interactive domain-containing protein 4 [Iris pallida]|uniref:AT-rich interactive domain-containing protein 4 n=1 Tax=Iris pallida TaxID=29817 RepID=A0AAX6DZB0_IRIPA|nr:AT-rich interactive domain-containing protein 4 [Iris pallida]
MHSKGCPYVIYWKHAFSSYAACHFRQALLSLVQSSCRHMWDAFQLAHASFSLYYVQNNYVLPRDSQNITGKLGPRLLGAPAKIKIDLPEINMDEEEGPSDPSLL